MEATIAWVKQFKHNHSCSTCPFVKNDADIGVGVLYDCDRICAMETEEIAAYCAGLGENPDGPGQNAARREESNAW